MKKSKMFIGLSVALLAGIGAFASAKTFRNTDYYYFVGSVCTKISEPTTCTGTGNPCKGTLPADSGKQLYGDDLCTVVLSKS